MSLWSKPIGDLQWQDVVDFCNTGYAEGVRVDYKSDFPEKEKLEKTVAALANTLGGIMLIGINADRVTNKPVEPYEGIPISKGITERIDRRCIDHIYPSVLPEAAVVMRPDAPDRGVVVVRVLESIRAPHAIQNTTLIYVRRDDHSDPEELAELRWIEHLLQRRAEPEALRRRLDTKATERMRATSGTQPVVTLSTSPSYPSQPLKPDRAVMQWLRSAFQRGLYSEGEHSPVQPFAGGAMQTRWSKIGEHSPLLVTEYMEFHAVGFSLFAEIPEHFLSREEQQTTPFIDQRSVMIFVASYLADARAFLEFLGYRGNVNVKLEIAGVQGWSIALKETHPDVTMAVCRDNAVAAEVSMLESAVFTAETAHALVSQLRWAIGSPTDVLKLEHYRPYVEGAARRWPK